jgi:hypothetical protein
MYHGNLQKLRKKRILYSPTLLILPLSLFDYLQVLIDESLVVKDLEPDSMDGVTSSSKGNIYGNGKRMRKYH